MKNLIARTSWKNSSQKMLMIIYLNLVMMIIYIGPHMNISMMKIVITIMITMVMLELINMIILITLKISTITVASIMIKEIRKKLRQKNRTLTKFIVI